MEITFYSDLPVEDNNIEILVTDDGVVKDIDDWANLVIQTQPRIIIPPFKVDRPAWSGRCAERALAILYADIKHVGAVVCGRDAKERAAYFMWAQENKYSPIVFLPHWTKNRMRQLMELHTTRLLRPTTWIHFADGGDETFDPTAFPGSYTYSEPFFKD